MNETSLGDAIEKSLEIVSEIHVTEWPEDTWIDLPDGWRLNLSHGLLHCTAVLHRSGDCTTGHLVYRGPYSLDLAEKKGYRE